MSRSWLLAAGVAVLIGGLVTIGWFISTSHEVRRSQEYVQGKITGHLPKTAHGVTAREARVNFENNRVVILASVDGTRFKKNFSMVVEAIGVPDYQNSRNGEFYFKPEQISVYDFQIDDPNPRSLFNRLPERYKGKVEDWMVKAAEHGAVLALERVPVYRVKDDNLGWVIHSSLQNVRIDGNELVITYSVWHIAMMVIIGIVVVVIAILLIAAGAGDALLMFWWF